MPDTTLTSAELDELEALAKAATPGDLDTVNDPPDEYGGKSATGWYECPCCESVGEVEGVTYSNFDAVAMGVQFFGIGNEHKNYEAFFRAANPATILRLLSLARAGLEAGKAEESMRLKAARVIEKQIEVIVNEHGSYEPDTNYTNLPDWAETVCEELENSLTAIRALPLTGDDNGSQQS